LDGENEICATSGTRKGTSARPQDLKGSIGAAPGLTKVNRRDVRTHKGKSVRPQDGRSTLSDRRAHTTEYLRVPRARHVNSARPPGVHTRNFVWRKQKKTKKKSRNIPKSGFSKKKVPKSFSKISRNIPKLLLKIPKKSRNYILEIPEIS
jgi:hypothetical protein